MKRVIVIGGPRAGKSTYASKTGLPHYCTDPKSLVKDPLPNVTYLPEGLSWGDDSEFIVKYWFMKNTDWVIEGVGAVRALRKWAEKYPYTNPCNEIVLIHGHHPSVTMLDGQESMSKGIMTVWGGISGRYNSITRHIQQ